MMFNNPQDILPQWWFDEDYPGAKRSSTNYRVIRKKVDIFKYSKRKVMMTVAMLIMVMVMTILMLMLFTLTLISTRWGDGGWVPPTICRTPSKVNFLEFGKNPLMLSLFHQNYKTPTIKTWNGLSRLKLFGELLRKSANFESAGVSTRRRQKSPKLQIFTQSLQWIRWTQIPANI